MLVYRLALAGYYATLSFSAAPNPMPDSWAAVYIGSTLITAIMVGLFFRLSVLQLSVCIASLNAMYVITAVRGGSALLLSFPVLIYVLAASAVAIFLSIQTESREYALFNEREAANREREAAIKASAEAEAATQAMSYFIATASHDLRQPLTAMSLWTERLVKTSESPSSAEIAVEIQRSVTSLREMFDSLMDLSRLDSASIRIDKTPVDVATVLSALQAEYSDRAIAKGLELNVFAPEKLFIESDRVQLTRLVRNLLHNAVTYTQSGSIILGAKRLPNARIEVYVEDTGPGIPSALHSRVFDEYFQVDNPARDRSKGLGLGLPIVRRLAALLELEVQLTSTVGEGSRFSIRGAEALGRAIALAPSAAKEAERLRGLTILLVEDDPSISLALTTVFGDAGAKTLHADSMPSALSAMAQKPDVAIVDYRLQVQESGLEIAYAIQELNCDLPIIIQTGESEESTMDLLLRSPFYVLQKPVDTQELFFAIRAAV